MQFRSFLFHYYSPNILIHVILIFGLSVVSTDCVRAIDDFMFSMRAHTFISSPEHSGWIWRKRTSWMTSFSPSNRRWRRCWCTLRGLQLTFYTEPPTTPANDSPSRKCVAQRFVINKESMLLDYAEGESDFRCF